MMDLGKHFYNGKIYFQGNFERGYQVTGAAVETSYQSGIFSVDEFDRIVLEMDSRQLSEDSTVDTSPEFYSIHFKSSTFYYSWKDHSSADRSKRIVLNSSNNAGYPVTSRVDIPPIEMDDQSAQKVVGIRVKVIPTNDGYESGAELKVYTRGYEWEDWGEKITRDSSSSMALSGAKPIIYTFVKDDTGATLIEDINPQIGVTVKEGVSIQYIDLLLQPVNNQAFDL